MFKVSNELNIQTSLVTENYIQILISFEYNPELR